MQPLDALTIAREIVIRLNLERQALGLALLETPSGLMELASERAQELSSLGELTHAAPGEGSIRAQSLLVQAGYSGRMGETLLTAAVPASELAVTAVAAWMGDGPNRALLLEPGFRYGGVGIARDGEVWTIAMLFAERAPE